MIFDVLERRDPVLSNAPKNVKIGGETIKLGLQTYATVRNSMCSQSGITNTDLALVRRGLILCSLQAWGDTCR